MGGRVVTAGLTAYYMSRQVVLVFGGQARFEKPGPHGEPALHTAARVALGHAASRWSILAFFAFFGGVLNLPWAHTHSLESWLAPVFAGTLYNDHLTAVPSGPWP